jgi:hypothetical protein
MYVLDICLTIYRTEVCPGISDHDLVYIEATTKPVKIKTAPREAFLYKKADYDSINREGFIYKLV